MQGRNKNKRQKFKELKHVVTSQNLLLFIFYFIPERAWYLLVLYKYHCWRIEFSNYSWSWWHTPVILALKKMETGESETYGHPQPLHSEFKVIQGYVDPVSKSKTKTVRRRKERGYTQVVLLASHHEEGTVAFMIPLRHFPRSSWVTNLFSRGWFRRVLVSAIPVCPLWVFLHRTEEQCSLVHLGWAWCARQQCWQAARWGRCFWRCSQTHLIPPNT